MTCRLPRGLAAATLAFALTGSVAAADPVTPADPAAFDKLVRDTLASVHNTGADLYNVSKDYAGTYRLYEGALRTTRPLLAHRAESQKTIDAGLDAAGKETDVARKAFLLHEAIEKVRADLKTPVAEPKKTTPEPKKTEEPKKTTPEPKKTEPTPEPKKTTPEPKKTTEPTPEPKKTTEPTPEPKKTTPEPKKTTTPPTEPKKTTPEPKPTTPEPKKTETPSTVAPMPKPKEPAVPAGGASVSGTVTLKGKPLAAGELTLISADLKVTTAKVTDGKYAVKDLPAGKYKVAVTGGKDVKLPEKYATTDTSALTAEVKAGTNTLDFELK